MAFNAASPTVTGSAAAGPIAFLQIHPVLLQLSDSVRSRVGPMLDHRAFAPMD